MKLPHSLRPTVNSNEALFQSGSGANIFYRCWTPAEPRAVILLVHGLAEHGGRYDEFANFFADAGIATYVPDLPGHGNSDGERGYVRSFREYTVALRDLLAIVRQAYPDIPCVLFGHSMGGLIAADFLLQHQDEFVAAVLTGAAIRAPKQPSATALFVNKLIAAIMPHFGAMQLDASSISRDPQVVSDYDNDPLVYRGKVSARLVSELFDAMNRVVTNAATIQLPLLIMHASEDRLTAVEGSTLLHEKVSSNDKKLVIYEGLYHEILNEPERKNVMDDIVRWLEPRLNRG